MDKKEEKIAKIIWFPIIIGIIFTILATIYGYIKDFSLMSFFAEIESIILNIFISLIFFSLVYLIIFLYNHVPKKFQIFHNNEALLPFFFFALIVFSFIYSFNYIISDYNIDFEDYGYKCTENCEGHEAGYDWAKNNNIQQTYNCEGKSQSFIEGCLTYIEREKQKERDSWENEGLWVQ